MIPPRASRRLGTRVAPAALALALAATGAASQGTLARRADAIASAYARTNRFWGAVLVARAGKVEFQKAYGTANLTWGIPATVGTKYEIASLTKAFTGVAIAQLAAAGKLGLDDPVARYYAAAPPAWQPITAPVREIAGKLEELALD